MSPLAYLILHDGGIMGLVVDVLVFILVVVVLIWAIRQFAGR